MNFQRKWSSLHFRFLVLAACLLPIGALTFHSDWRPLSWKHAHFAEGDIGEAILTCSGLFFVFALGYFFFPKLFHRRINDLLGRVHFWLNVIGLLVSLFLPIYFNLVLQLPPGETKFQRFSQAFGLSIGSVLWQILVLAAVQMVFLANVLWSIFKGERTSSLTSAR